VEAVTEGKGFCRRRQEITAEKQLKKDLKSLDKIVVIANRDKRKMTACILYLYL
jgi:hypothetical protein